MELPDFHEPHEDKIAWMIQTNGWALEAVSPQPDSEPPVPSYAYSIGLPAAVNFCDIAVFGLTPVAARGLIELVVDACRGGTEIPLGTELLGLLDNELRCLFAPIDPDLCGTWFPIAAQWYGDEPVQMVQLIYPDRRGFLPYEYGFDQRMRFAQPLIGSVPA
jgi:hypothetical protein